MSLDRWRLIALSPRFSKLQIAQLETWWNSCRNWWDRLSSRERVLLGSLAGVALFALFLVGVLNPLRAMRSNADAELHNAEVLNAKLRQGGPALSSPALHLRGSASAVLTDSASAAKLTIQRIEPEGGNTRIELGDAPFGDVITWVRDVERSSRLRVQKAQIEHKNAPGIVSASFVFSE